LQRLELRPNQVVGLVVGDVRSKGFGPATRASLAEGDVILMLTDGFRNASDSKWESFGQKRIVATVLANLHRTAREIMDVLCDSAIGFADKSHLLDDMTGIVVKVMDTQPRWTVVFSRRSFGNDPIAMRCPNPFRRFTHAGSTWFIASHSRCPTNFTCESSHLSSGL
jgi:Stage II sporulation protein E (SpoIIE)